MSGRFSHAAHVVRAALLLAGGLLAFLFVRSMLVPSDFGVYGFYRAGALEDIKKQPPKFAGQAACITCHTVQDEERQGARHARIGCETCHGPLAAHAADFEQKPPALDARTLCVSCHLKSAGKPAGFPQIVPADHEPGKVCTDCHKPHHPKLPPAGAKSKSK